MLHFYTLWKQKMPAAHLACCSAAGVKNDFTGMIQRINFILYVHGIIFTLLPVLCELLLWNCELSGVKTAIYICF